MADNTITFGCNLSVDNFWDLPEFAKRAEDLGFDRVAIGEHVMDGNPPRPTAMGLPAMAAAAGATTRLRVLTGIVIAPLYHPVMLAKLVATVDQISGGRLDFGIGISGQRDTRAEFDALEIPVNTRGRRTDEILRAMKQLWQEDHVSHHGRFFNYDDVTLLPKPFQQPYPPIWVAGRSDAAVRRAAIAGDGWYPYLFTVNRLRRSNASVRDMAEQSGRDLSRFHWGAEDIARALCITGNAEDCIGAVQERIDAGVRDFVFGFLAGEADDYFRQMELFSSRVLTHFK
ncbi:FMNH(2)-dependent dimethylsulfone monooxygenase [Geodia barretti]|uniref:FMNH(2)-dependent dimethylsulfone monooxygenase n=1 Tax=Geodia barretti TaxID=519541 RepID=A0AA35R623_GEOBA|nr:FMNH(2)-dependent dimethylsulfone monooxygenase [Geodia barretti]